MDIIEKIERTERAIYNIAEAIEEMRAIDTIMVEYWEEDLADLKKIKEKFEKVLEKENR